MSGALLVLNAGSSSLKFQVYAQDGEADPVVLWRGLYDGLGGPGARFAAKDGRGAAADAADLPPDRSSHEAAIGHLLDWLRGRAGTGPLIAVGHRVVHGGEAWAGPVIVDDAVLADLEGLVALAPLHMPHNLAPIRLLRRLAPDLKQIACFDTAFHRTQPGITTLFALPKAIRDRGVRRYGFHGLSYDHIASVLHRYDPALAGGRVIVAHLGNGASLCALRRGVSIATTMGFSTLDGLTMGTRPGALDPAVIFYMLREMRLSPDEAEDILYRKSGLLGLSGLSNDMRRLRSESAENADARLAIEHFVYRIRREIGSLMAALGGLDGLVFTAGIGENDAATRAEVLAGLGWAGFTLDEAANAAHGPRISRGDGPSAWVIPTDEEIVIARQMRVLIASGATPGAARLP